MAFPSPALTLETLVRTKAARKAEEIIAVREGKEERGVMQHPGAEDPFYNEKSEIAIPLLAGVLNTRSTTISWLAGVRCCLTVSICKRGRSSKAHHIQ